MHALPLHRTGATPSGLSGPRVAVGPVLTLAWPSAVLATEVEPMTSSRNNLMSLAPRSLAPSCSSGW